MLKGMQFRHHVCPRLFREGNFVLERADNWLEPSPRQTARGRNFSGTSLKSSRCSCRLHRSIVKRILIKQIASCVNTKYFIFLTRLCVDKRASNFASFHHWMKSLTDFSCKGLKASLNNSKLKN